MRTKRDLEDMFFPAIMTVIVLFVIGFIVYAIWYEVNDPGHGRITGREYSPAHLSCTTTGKVTTCTSHPECYRIKYTDGKHDGDACVSPQEYEMYRHETYYPAGGK